MSAPATNNTANRRWLIRAAGSVIILAMLFWLLPAGAILAGFSRVGPGLFFGVFLAFLAGHLLAAAKWWALLGRGMGFGIALRAHFAGLASNLLLPGVAGGDAVRAAVAQVHIKDGGRVVAGALADRLIDMLALACLSLAGVLLVQGEGANTALAVQVLALLAVLVIGALFVVPRFAPALWQRFPRLPAKGLVTRICTVLQDLGRQPALLIGALALSISIQGLFVFLAVQLALAVGVAIPIAAWFFAWPLAKILATLPISLGGLGVREASLAALLVPFGALASDVVASGLIWQAVLFLTGGLGALILSITGFSLTKNPPTPVTPKSRAVK